MVGKAAVTCRTSPVGWEEQQHRHLHRTEPSKAVVQPDSGDLFVTGFRCFRLAGVGNVSHGSSPAILPLFLMATWALSGNGLHITFVWEAKCT